MFIFVWYAGAYAPAYQTKINMLWKIMNQVGFIYKIMVDNLVYVDIKFFTQSDTYSNILHTRQSSTQNNKRQVSHKHGCFSWWWAHSRLKHVEERNKHTKKNYTPSWLYSQDYTGMHGHQNIKFINHYIAMNIVIYLHGCTCKFYNTFVVSEWTNKTNWCVI